MGPYQQPLNKLLELLDIQVGDFFDNNHIPFDVPFVQPQNNGNHPPLPKSQQHGRA